MNPYDPDLIEAKNEYMKKIQNTRQENPENSTESVQRKFFCTDCGNKLEMGHKFCTKCGKKID